MAQLPDDEFVDRLRATVLAYVQAVDRWEAAYGKYYRMPGHAETISSDMQSEQREYDAQRRALKLLLPRARQLCLKHQLRNPFPGLLRVSLGRYAPQQRIESAIGRNERSELVYGIEKLADACRGFAPTAVTDADAQEASQAKPQAGLFDRSRVWLALVICVLAAIGFVMNRRSPGVPARQNGVADQPPYGEHSGADVRKAWLTERKRESSRFTDADFERMVNRLFVKDDPGRANFHGLLYAGARPVPWLLKALDEPRTYTTVYPSAGVDIEGYSPFDRICMLLDETAPAEAVTPLARYVEHPDPKFRQMAASLLARIGTSECLDPVKRALADRDRNVRALTLSGLMRGLDAKQRDEKFLGGVFAALVPLLSTGTYDGQTPAGVLAAIDTAKAIPILESPRYFSVRNPQLREVLTALDSKDVKVPHPILLPLLAELKPLAAKELVQEWAYATALYLYARNPDAHAESQFRALLYSRSGAMASAAADGLQLLAGVDPHKTVFDVYEQRGFAAMTKPQQFDFAIETYLGEVSNGGHEQYFYNDDSDLVQTAIEGLRAIGATSKAVILSDARLAFAPQLPAPLNRERRLQMSQFDQSQDGIFKIADKRFYQSEDTPEERLFVLLALYALKHPADFANVAPPSGKR